MSKLKIEIVCGNMESVIAAQQGGADRVELCDNLSEGGTTPSYGMIEAARRYLYIPMHVMIRPRSGDFLYSEEEFEIMKRDVEICKQLKADGVVFGILTAGGNVDKDRVKELVKLASPMSVTFHRAFDLTADAMKSLEDIIECKCHRMLTSGQEANATAGAVLISQLVDRADSRISIMPGGGIGPENISSLLAKTKATEFHASAKKILTGKMDYKRAQVAMGNSGMNEYSIWVTDADTVKQLKAAAVIH